MVDEVNATMGKRKKKKSNTPRHKRMKRPQRLQAARHWIPKYDGKNLVKGYSKHFGVNKLCAVKELEMLGYTYSSAYKQQLKENELQKQRTAKKRKARKQMETEEEWDGFSNETFAFIAGYTSGGVPFGTTWEELENTTDDMDKLPEPDVDSLYGDRNTKNKFDINDDDLPF